MSRTMTTEQRRKHRTPEERRRARVSARLARIAAAELAASPLAGNR